RVPPAGPRTAAGATARPCLRGRACARRWRPPRWCSPRSPAAPIAPTRCPSPAGCGARQAWSARVPPSRVPDRRVHDLPQPAGELLRPPRGGVLVPAAYELRVELVVGPQALDRALHLVRGLRIEVESGVAQLLGHGVDAGDGHRAAH